MKLKKLLFSLCLVPLALCSCSIFVKDTTPEPTDTDVTPSTDNDVKPPTVLPPDSSNTGDTDKPSLPPDDNTDVGDKDDNPDVSDPSQETETPPSPSEGTKTYMVIYYNSDGSVNTVVNVKDKTTYDIDKSITTTRTGDESITYVFLGWSTKKNDTTPKDSIVVREDVELYPVFIKHMTYVTVKIVYRDDLIEGETRKLKYGSEFNPKEETLPKTFDKFGFWGWFEDANYTKQITETIVIKNNMTIYGDVSPYESVKSDVLYYSTNEYEFSSTIPTSNLATYSQPLNTISETENGYYSYKETVESKSNLSWNKREFGSGKELSELSDGAICTTMPEGFDVGAEKLYLIEPIKNARINVYKPIQIENKYYLIFQFAESDHTYSNQHFKFSIEAASLEDAQNNFSTHLEKLKNYIISCSVLTVDNICSVLTVDNIYILNVSLLEYFFPKPTTTLKLSDAWFEVNFFDRRNNYTIYELNSKKVYYFVYEYYEYKDTREE